MISRSRKTFYILFCLAVISVLLVLLDTVVFSGGIDEVDKTKGTEDSLKIDEEQEPIKEKKLSLIMGGDALIHSAVYEDAKEGSGYNFNKMLDKIKPIVKSYDLAFYNQETILGGEELGLSTYPCFNSPYEVGDAFLDSGFNIVSLANNHTLDRGSKAIINSRNYWNDKDVIVNGSATSLDERNNIVIKEVNGIKYTMLAYTTTTNGIKRKQEEYVNIYSPEVVKKDIEQVRDKVDLLLVSMHWGIEYNNGVSNKQKEIANFLADNGVDIVIGTHPHVVEPVEFIDKTLVIYSLGNLISAQRGINKLSGMLFSVDITKEDSGIVITNPKAQFIYTYSSGNPRSNFKVYPYTELDENILPDYKKYYAELVNRVRTYDSAIAVE